jgi:hypothetical protein
MMLMLMKKCRLSSDGVVFLSFSVGRDITFLYPVFCPNFTLLKSAVVLSSCRRHHPPPP